MIVTTTLVQGQGVPAITAFTPNIGPQGTSVALQGMNLQIKQTINMVNFIGNLINEIKMLGAIQSDAKTFKTYTTFRKV
jgi:hypothetical protein